jgi:glycine/sarcosine N-methyltransferase
MGTPMYDDLSADYDRFVRWERRLAFELPFIEHQLEQAGARRVLDAACGTGQHAIALSRCGYEMVGADLSEGMIAQARRNAAAEGVPVSFVEAGFGHMATATAGTFDAVLCLGNSLPHVLSGDGLATTLRDWAAVLRPGGMLFVQSRNFDRVLAEEDRWMPPQAYREDGREWLFVRFYDLREDGMLIFNMIRLRREGEGTWKQDVTSTELRPWQRAELAEVVEWAGYDQIRYFGDMQGHAWEEESPNLIVVATRSEAER